LTEREQFRFVTCIKEEPLNIQLMRMNYVPKHSQNLAASEFLSYVWIDGKGAEFVGNKQT